MFHWNVEQFDHVSISPGIVEHKTSVEHVHVNNWSPSFDGRVSDCDPSVNRIWIIIHPVIIFRSQCKNPEGSVDHLKIVLLCLCLLGNNTSSRYKFDQRFYEQPPDVKAVVGIQIKNARSPFCQAKRR